MKKERLSPRNHRVENFLCELRRNTINRPVRLSIADLQSNYHIGKFGRVPELAGFVEKTGRSEWKWIWPSPLDRAAVQHYIVAQAEYQALKNAERKKRNKMSMPRPQEPKDPQLELGFNDIRFPLKVTGTFAGFEFDVTIDNVKNK